MITKKFIEKVHRAFETLGYRETESPDFSAFEAAAFHTLTHCGELSDATEAVRMYSFCFKEWGKILKLFEKKRARFSAMPFGASPLPLLSDEAARGIYYLGSGLYGRGEDIFAASFSLEGGAYSFRRPNGSFVAFKNGDLELRHAKQSGKMELFSRDGCVCRIGINERGEVFWEENKTPFGLVVYENFLCVYDRDYLEHSRRKEHDAEKLLADIEWNLLGGSPALGIAKLSLFSHSADREMMLLFAAAALLICQSDARARRAAANFPAETPRN